MKVSAVSAGATAGSTSLPSMSVYASANTGFILREVGIFNTTTTAARYALVRLSTLGTQGSALTKIVHGPDSTATSVSSAYATHTVGPTITGNIAPLPLGAAAGAGTILTFYGENNGIYVPKGTGNGIGIVVLSGTGQVSDIYAIWEE